MDKAEKNVVQSRDEKMVKQRDKIIVKEVRITTNKEIPPLQKEMVEQKTVTKTKEIEHMKIISLHSLLYF